MNLASEFVPDAWYVGAWSHEVGRQPLQRWMLGEPVVFYRTEAGEPVALDDRCPHRYAPLSAGKLDGDTIVCGYHGFTFGADGACVAVPGVSRTPKNICVKSYPVVDKWGWVFVWMGDAESANEDALPDFHYLDDPEWTGGGETLVVKASYNLIRDNLLDLTHAKFLHKATLSNDSVTEFPISVEENPGRLNIRRTMENIEKTSLFLTGLGGFTENVTHWQNVEFLPPNNVVINVGVHSAASASEDKRVELRILNAITPETRTTSQYHWAILRNFDIGNEELTAYTVAQNAGAFEEDRWMVEQQQQMWATRPDAAAVPYVHDKGVVKANEIVAEMLASPARDAAE
jgi:vanillate O-demethylase monooxygenase subunit